MTRRRSKKPPTPPADIIARRAERREMESRGITVNVDERTEEITGAWRPDCFSTLLKRQPDEHGAVLWLEALIRTANGEITQERTPGHIRGSVEGAPGQNVSQVMIDASVELAAVEESLYPACARLLFGLLLPDAALESRWRDVVRKHTGETNAQAQGAMVRASAANLLWVQQNIGRLARDRKERRVAA